MVDRKDIREKMEVIGADGVHVGTVERIEDNRIRLASDDRGAGGATHWIPLGLVEEVDADAVRLSMLAELAPQFWETEDGGSRAGGPA